MKSFLHSRLHGLTVVVILALVATAARSCFGGAYSTHPVATAAPSPPDSLSALLNCWRTGLAH